TGPSIAFTYLFVPLGAPLEASLRQQCEDAAVAWAESQGLAPQQPVPAAQLYCRKPPGGFCAAKRVNDHCEPDVDSCGDGYDAKVDRKEIELPGGAGSEILCNCGCRRPPTVSVAPSANLDLTGGLLPVWLPADKSPLACGVGRGPEIDSLPSSSSSC